MTSRPARRLRWRAILPWLLVALPIVLSSNAGAGNSVPTALEAFLARPWFTQATWGVMVAEAGSDRVVFEANAHTLLKPASTAKLFTAALALDRLGPDYRIPTELRFQGRLTSRGTLLGDVIVEGHGDFSFGARFHDGDYRRSLERLTEAFRAAGVRRVRGDLVAQDDSFVGAPFGGGWTWDDLQYYYGAEVSALTTDDNVIDVLFHPGRAPGDAVTLEIRPATDYLTFTTDGLITGPARGDRNLVLTRAAGSRGVTCVGTLPAGGEVWTDAVTVPEPALFLVHRLREALFQQGIRVLGEVRHSPGGSLEDRMDTVRRSVRKDSKPVIRSAIASPPLRELVRAMMKPSQNLYAQLLLLQVGARQGARALKETTEAAGLRDLRAFAADAGIPAGEVLLDDGSGLSRSGLVTPSALVALLRHMDHHRSRDAFLEALPVAGVDGTLRRRFKGTVCEGNLRAKTGTLRYVHALAGFVTNRVGQRLAFAALLNGYEPSDGAPSGREAVEEVGRILGESGAVE